MTNYKFVKDCNVPEAPTAPIVVPNDSPINPLVALPTNPAVPLELFAKFLPCKTKNRYPCPTITVEDTVGADGTPGSSTVSYNCTDDAELDIDFDIESYCCDVVEDDDGNAVTSDKLVLTPKVELSLPYPAIITKGWLHYFNKTGVDAYITSYNSSHTDQISICERCWTSTHVTAAKNYSATPLYKIWYFQSKSKDPDENPQKSYLVPVVDVEDEYITDATWHEENDKVLGSIDRCSCTASVLNDLSEEETVVRTTVLRGNGYSDGSGYVWNVRAKSGEETINYTSLSIDESSYSAIPSGALVSLELKFTGDVTNQEYVYVTAIGYSVPNHTGLVYSNCAANASTTVTLPAGEYFYDTDSSVTAKNLTNHIVYAGDKVCLQYINGGWCFFSFTGDTNETISVSGVTNGSVATYNNAPVLCDCTNLEAGYLVEGMYPLRRCSVPCAFNDSNNLMFQVPGRSSYWYSTSSIDASSWRSYCYSLDGGCTFYSNVQTVSCVQCYGYKTINDEHYYFPVNNVGGPAYTWDDTGYYADYTLCNEYGVVTEYNPTVSATTLNTVSTGKHRYTYSLTSGTGVVGNAYMKCYLNKPYVYGSITLTEPSPDITYNFDTRDTLTHSSEYGYYSANLTGSSVTCTFHAGNIETYFQFYPYEYAKNGARYCSKIYASSGNYYYDVNRLYRYKLTSSCLNSTLTLKDIASSDTITKTFQELLDNDWAGKEIIWINGVNYKITTSSGVYTLPREQIYDIPNTVTFTATSESGTFEAVVYKVVLE